MVSVLIGYYYFLLLLKFPLKYLSFKIEKTELLIFTAELSLRPTLSRTKHSDIRLRLRSATKLRLLSRAEMTFQTLIKLRFHLWEPGGLQIIQLIILPVITNSPKESHKKELICSWAKLSSGKIPVGIWRVCVLIAIHIPKGESIVY